VAADEVIAPIQCEYFSLEGLSQLLQTITLVRENLEHPLKVTGALLTMYDKRERHSREIAREVRRRFPHRVFDVEIPRSVALAEAPHYKKPIMLYAPLSPGALAYEALADEVLREAYGVLAAEGVPPAPPAPADYPQYPRLDPTAEHSL